MVFVCLILELVSSPRSLYFIYTYIYFIRRIFYAFYSTFFFFPHLVVAADSCSVCCFTCSMPQKSLVRELPSPAVVTLFYMYADLFFVLSLNEYLSFHIHIHCLLFFLFSPCSFLFLIFSAFYTIVWLNALLKML